MITPIEPRCKEKCLPMIQPRFTRIPFVWYQRILFPKKKVLPHKDNANGWEDFLSLKDLYEGVGEYAKAVLADENYIQELCYVGEKKSHMRWDEFEIRLTNTFAIFDKDTGRQVHTDK